MSYRLINKPFVIFILFLFVCGAVVPSFSVGSTEIVTQETINNQDDKVVTCYIFDKKGNSKQEVVLASEEFDRFYSIFKDLNYMINNQPFSSKNEVLKTEFAVILEDLGMIPEGLSEEDVISLMNPSMGKHRPLFSLLSSPISNGRGSAFFCNFATWGEGSQFPVIILPRLIPILLVPIPRVAMRWNAVDGITSCGGLLSGKGFIAEGAQQGTALGFWGIGFSVFLPPVMEFGFIGYALFATATADIIHPWPPNRPPVISGEEPAGGTWDVPLGLSELSFRIEDADGDLMDYKVTTEPDIGSGIGKNKRDGVYKVPVSGLKIGTQYKWTIEVSDKEDTSFQENSFITEIKPFDPFEEGWQYRKKITINHTQITADHINFPVLISTFDNDLRNKAQNDGDDILFMGGSSVANKLYHEIEEYDSSSGKLVAWVKVPKISDTLDTVFYLYYGNTNCGSQQFSEVVWDSDYCGVWHLNDFTDSTHNKNDGTNHGATNCEGKIGNAKRFAGANEDYIKVLDSPSLDITEEITLSSWVKFDTLSIRYPPFIIYKRGDINDWQDPYKIGIADNENGGEFRINGELVVGGKVATGQWYNIVGTFNGNQKKLYINGLIIADETDEAAIQTSSGNLYIGADYDSGGMNQFLDGVIDEVKIINKSRSSDWILTEYNNQNDPLSFFVIGPEESKP